MKKNLRAWVFGDYSEELTEKIGENYDGAIKRSRFLRWTFLIVSILTFLLLPGITLNWLGNLVFNTPQKLESLLSIIGALVGGLWFSNYFPNYLVVVPQVQGFVTVNNAKSILGIPGKTYDEYGPGTHVAYPWEGRSSKSNYSLEVVTIDLEESVPGKDTQLITTGALQIEASLSRGSQFIGIDEDTIKKGALELIKAKLSDKLHNKTGDEAKGMIPQINDELAEIFKSDEWVTKFENIYGFRTVVINISGIDLPEDVQKTRDAVDEARQVLRGVAIMNGYESEEALIKVRKNGELSNADFNEMVDRFMVKSKQAKMQVNSLKLGGIDLKDLASIIKAFKGD
ncbi:MAG: hypothetical protein LR017_03630 [Candidatus Pacebacteria bacterium]|nr:hypothetical protein [Candidatus Paceibacterota bacterium]